MINKKESGLKERYQKEVRKTLADEFGIKNTMAVPRLIKIVVNAGVGNTLKDKSLLEKAVEELSAITGQKPSIRQAKVSVASFSLRRGMSVGLKVTLRGEKMYAFLDRLSSIVLPRLRDFRGISEKSFDQAGNYSLGIAEHTVFPEIDITKSTPRGIEITFVTSTKNLKEAKALLSALGLPFEK